MEKDDFIKKVYLYLKFEFSKIEKTNWIWIDYFKNEESGYVYFKETYLSDMENISKYYNNDSEEEENINNIAEYIENKLNESNCYHIFSQCMI